MNDTISGATAATYLLVATDKDKYITVTVTRAGNSGSVTSTPVTGQVAPGTGSYNNGTHYWIDGSDQDGHIAFTGGTAATSSSVAGWIVTIAASGTLGTDYDVGSQRWYIKGAEDRSSGRYVICLRGTKGGKQYYAKFTVTVE